MITLNDYNIKITNISNTILDYKATTDKEFFVCSDLQVKYAKCGECGSVYAVNLSCNKRTCLACQVKRGVRLFRKYVGIVRSWDLKSDYKIQFLTITNVNVRELSKDYIVGRDKLLKKFLLFLKKSGIVVDYGFLNKECTWSEKKGYHYHYHLLFYGPGIDLKKLNLSNIWRNVSKDSYMVKLYSKFNNGEHSLRYLLKYVCKVQENDDAMKLYYAITKGQRYFQTFGLKYKGQDVEKLPFICSSCFGSFMKNRFERGCLFDRARLNFRDEDLKKINYPRLRYHYELSLKSSVVKGQSTLSLVVGELEVSNFADQLVERIRPYLQVDFNVELIEEELGSKNLKYLLDLGYLYLPRSTRYELV